MRSILKSFGEGCGVGQSWNVIGEGEDGALHKIADRAADKIIAQRERIDLKRPDLLRERRSALSSAEVRGA